MIITREQYAEAYGALFSLSEAVGKLSMCPGMDDIASKLAKAEIEINTRLCDYHIGDPVIPERSAEG